MYPVTVTYNGMCGSAAHQAGLHHNCRRKNSWKNLGANFKFELNPGLNPNSSLAGTICLANQVSCFPSEYSA